MKKTEERKENETNSLRLWAEHMRERLQGRSLYMVVGGLVLLVAAIAIYRYWRISQANAASNRIVELFLIDSDKGLDTFINSPANQGKQPTVWARLQKARLTLYTDGIARLGSYTPDDRDKAVEKVEEGRKRYEEIVNELEDDAWKQEAYFSLARAEECLLSKPKKDKTTEMRGSLDRAIEYYRKAAAINSDSEASKRYAATAAKLKANRGDIEGFYRRLDQLGFTPMLPTTEKGDFPHFGPGPKD